MKVRGTPIMLEDKYRLVGEIGRGGMGLVFRAQDISLDRFVAVKFLLPELVSDPLLVERFHDEALAMASVRHPNVAQIYSFGWYGRTPYFVMEYASGMTVDVLLDGARKRNSFIPLRDALHIIDQAAAGLDAVHSAEVVHRDVKPGNLIFEPETDRVLIMDFGIGHRIDPTAMSTLVSVGGTPAYMAPEVISGETTPATEESLADIYALGISAFELLTGQLPCECESWLEALTWHLADDPPRPSSIRPGLPGGLDEVILGCLEKDPTRRHRRASTFRNALRPYLIEVERRPRQRRVKKTSTPPPRATPSGAPAPAARRPAREATPSGASAGERADERGAHRTSHVVVKAWKPTVCLVRPGPALQRMVQQALEAESLEAEVESVERVEQAAAMAGDGRAQVLVARLHDPELSGFELARMSCDDQASGRFALVLTTDEEEDGEREQLEELGVVDLLTRPISPQSLREALRRSLQLPSQSLSAVG